MDTNKVAIRASTQTHLEIEDIKDGIVILKDGSTCLILAITSINFDLLSEKEQEATIYAYSGLLNSLSFPIQILIRSEQKDISAYLKLLEETAQKEKRQIIKKQIAKYRQFVQETVQKNNVLDKKFYLVIPMSVLELGVAKSAVTVIKPQKTLPFDEDYILQRAKINLYPKRDHILRLLARIGIRGQQLETQELIKLYFNIYNPESHGQQTVETKQYQSPLVQSTLSPRAEVTQTPASEIKREPGPEEKSIRDKINGLVKEASQ